MVHGSKKKPSTQKWVEGYFYALFQSNFVSNFVSSKLYTWRETCYFTACNFYVTAYKIYRETA